MSVLDVTKSVADITRNLPGADRVFEHLGIDYSCRGHELLIDAVQSHSLSVEDVLAQLGEAARESSSEGSIPKEPEALIALIVDKHHSLARTELARLPRLISKVRRIHASEHPELRVVQTLIDTLSSDLAPHMLKEERILFPYIANLARGERARAPFAQLDSPIAALADEHEAIGETLGQLERVTGRYQAPPDADSSYRTLYRVLRELQADLHRHLYLENYVLFPQARALERYLARSTG